MMYPVDSSCVAEIGYEASSKIAFVRFKRNSSLYMYAGVSRKKFRSLKNAASVGKYFCKYFRYVYSYERLE